jgi:hypothetical protein
VKYIKEYFMMFRINVITVFLSLLCVSCGGGGDSTSTASTPDIQIPVVMIQPTVFTGVFLDSAVEGLSYTTATNSGITNTFGEFSYQTNEDVTFSIGNIQLPAVSADSVLTPLDVMGTDNINHPSVVNVLRLLQSLDEDGIADNGIKIPAVALELAKELTVDFASPDFESQVAGLVQMSGGVYQQLISTEEAVYHFQVTIAALKNQSITNCAKTHSKLGHYGFFDSRAHNVSGRAEFIDDCTIKITEFNYDGGGPEVYFYGAVDHMYSEDAAFAIGQKINGIVYNNNEVILRIPDNKTLDDITGISVWCADFDANFGQVTFTP